MLTERGRNPVPGDRLMVEKRAALQASVTSADHPQTTMHDGQQRVTPELVRELVDDQFPAWRPLPISQVSSEGTANAIFLIGDHLAARFPLQPGDVRDIGQRLRAEADAARELRGRTRFPVPEPVALGTPGLGYPLPWSVQTWIPGTTASHVDPSTSAGFAHDLAEFIAEVRAIDVRGRTFASDGRGGDLRSHDAWMKVCFQNSEHLLDVPRLRRTWTRLRKLPRRSHDLMTHGDLIPGNVIVRNGRLAGVLDVGGLGPADPALDLVGAWHLLEPDLRELVRDDLGCDELEWERGKAWAFEQAMGLVWYYTVSNPAMSRMGRRTLERILTDEPPG